MGAMGLVINEVSAHLNIGGLIVKLPAYKAGLPGI